MLLHSGSIFTPLFPLSTHCSTVHRPLRAGLMHGANSTIYFEAGMLFVCADYISALSASRPKHQNFHLSVIDESLHSPSRHACMWHEHGLLNGHRPLGWIGLFIPEHSYSIQLCLKRRKKANMHSPATPWFSRRIVKATLLISDYLQSHQRLSGGWDLSVRCEPTKR